MSNQKTPDLTPEQLELAHRLAEEAIQLELPSAECAEFVRSRCEGDEAVFQEVMSLLRHGFEAEDEHFLAELPQLSDAGEGALPQADQPTPEIPGYRVLRLLGSGGMGQVWLAEQEHPRRTVALKLIRPGVSTPDLLRRFEHEAEVLGRLQHPGIAQIHEAGTADTGQGPQPFFAMELVEGLPLNTYAEQNKLGTRARLELAAKVCDAVQHAHQKGIIHRDLKPGNILVTAEGQPKILDFGVARATDADIQMTTLQTDIGQLIGTVPYMSPEQVAGDPAELDTRSDVYALGVVAYELLAGRLPYDLPQRMVAEAVRVIRDETPTPLSSINRVFRGDIDTIIGKALEKDKSRRYESASDLASDIRRYLSDEPIVARPPSASYQFRKYAARNKALVGGVAAVFVVLVLGVIGTSIGLTRALDAEQLAEQRLAEVETARDEAEKARTEERHRAEELEQVADFQSRMLSELDVEAMGRGIKERFCEQVRAGLERQYVGAYPNRRKRTADEIEAELAAYDKRANVTQAADVARRVMDEFVLRRAAEALESEFNDQPLVQAQIQGAIGSTYRALGLYDAAEPHLHAALKVRRREFGPEHEFVATDLNSLALLLHAKGDYVAAEPLYREALALWRKLPGGEHPDLATGLNNLAALLQDKGDYVAAEPLFREALALRRKLLGNEHLDVAISLHSLAALLHDKGDYTVAEPLYREALALRRKLLGDEHLHVAQSMNDLAVLLRHRGDYAGAEALSREALALHRKLLGDEHPHVVSCLNTLATLLREKGDYTAAEPLHRQALTLRRKLLGDEHPDVAVDLNNLALLSQHIGDYAAAEPMFREALAMWRKLLGDEHQLVALGLNNLAALLKDKRDYAAAEPLFREALALYRKLLGDEHPDVARGLNNLASLLKAKGDYAAAEPLYREALALWRKRPGDEHPNMVASLNNLAWLLRAKGDYAGAEPMFREALTELRRIRGNEHPYTQYSKIGLARTLTELSRFSEAEAFLLDAAEQCEHSKASRHRHWPGVLRSLVALYDAWHAAEPDKGYDAKAAEWRAKLEAWRTSTQPATSQPTSDSSDRPGEGHRVGPHQRERTARRSRNLREPSIRNPITANHTKRGIKAPNCFRELCVAVKQRVGRRSLGVRWPLKLRSLGARIVELEQETPLVGA